MHFDMKVLFFLLSGMLSLSCLHAQSAATAVPTVFIMGQHEAGYESLTQTYKQSLLGACGNDMQMAFDKWLEMMQQMESYADEIDYNIDGVKVLMHVFWNEDGTIAHLGYFLRPNSRNVPTAELTAFFKSFIRQYTFPVSSNQKFTHYTKASFPTFTERAQR